MTSNQYQYDPIDHEFMRLRGQLSPGARLQAMLAAREWVVSAMRARLRRRYPDQSVQEINLKVLEEIENVERRQARFDAQFWQSIKTAARAEASRNEGLAP